MIESNYDDERESMYVICPSAVQAEKENLGEAQAYCSVPEA